MSESSTAAAANSRASARERKLTFRGGGFVIEQRTWISVVAFLILVGLWQLATGTGLISPIFLPSPMRVLRALWDLAVTGDLWRHMSRSEEHTSELQSLAYLVCRLLLEKKK